MKEGISKNCSNCLNFTEACNRYKVSRWTLRRMINSYKLNGLTYKVQTVNIGRQTFVCQLDLRQMFAPIEHGPIEKPRSRKEERAIRKIEIGCKAVNIPRIVP